MRWETAVELWPQLGLYGAIPPKEERDKTNYTAGRERPGRGASDEASQTV